jgi:hypothetical protein
MLPRVLICYRKVRFNLQRTFLIVNHALARIINYASSSLNYDHKGVYSTGHCGYDCKLQS